MTTTPDPNEPTPLRPADAGHYPPPGMPVSPYPPPYQPAYQSAPQRDGMATAALVLGCLFWLPFAGSVCAILATIFGWISMRRTKNNPAVLGHGLAVAGFILGLIGVVIAALIIVLIITAIATTPTTSTGSLG